MHKKGRSRWNQGLLSAQRRVASVSVRCILLSAVVVLLTALPASAGPNLSYLYREIVNDIPGSSSYFDQPAINAFGQVAFRAFHEVSTTQSDVIPLGDPGIYTIYKGHVGSLETIVDNTVQFSEVRATPTMNDLGDVAFSALLATGGTEVLLYTAATQGLTTIAEGNLSDPLARFNSVSGGSVNNNGAVAFSAGNTNTQQQYIAAGTGGLPVYVKIIGPGQLSTPMINVAEGVIEAAWKADDALSSYIEMGNPMGHTPIAEGPSSLLDSITSAPSISNMGLVSFTAIPAGGFGEGVYLGNGGTPGLWANTTGEFDDFVTTSISSSELVFFAKLDSGGAGIFTGPNILTDKVLAVGDTVPGFPSTVETVQISRQAVNDNGQIAMDVKFADGSEAILRADPFDLQQLYETANTVTVFKAEGTSSLSQPISQQMSGSNGGEDLSFDYYFPGSTGQLAVTLGGELLAQIDAPAELANGFTTFQMPVDIGQLFPDPVDQLLLQFSLSGVGETGILFLDNIEFGSLVNGDFGTGNLAGWESTFFNDDSVGVAINPFYNAAAAVPEPAAILLALLGLALLPRRRRR